METLRELCAQYLCAREFELDIATKDTARLACRWFDGSPSACPPGRMDRSGGERFRNWLVATGRSQTTANMYVRAIKPILRWAVREQMLLEDPWSDVRQFHVDEKPVTIYEDWQFARMLHFLPSPTAADPQRDIRWLGILWGARVTGFRRGALLNLTWDNIRSGLVWQEPKKQSARTWPWRPKAGRVCKVPLVPQFAEVLDGLRDRHYPLVWPPTAVRLVNGELAGRWRKLPEINFGRTFGAIQRRAFGRRIGDFHQFRRTFTTDMAEALPDRAVMELTGHTRRETLSRYTSVRRSHWAAAYEVISRIGKGAPAGLQLPARGGLQASGGGPEYA